MQSRKAKGKKPVSELKGHVGFWLRFVSNHVSQRFAEKVAGCGVTVAEWVVLREMFDSETTSPGVLADGVGLTRGAVSKLVERLREKGLLTRAEAQGDRRFQDVCLTAAGRALVPRLAQLADANDAECFSQLTARERTELLRTLQKLVAANELGKFPLE